MKIPYEERRTLTFREWVSESTRTAGTRYPIVRIFANSEWRTVTFVTEEFRLNIKYKSEKEFNDIERGLRKVLSKHCRACVEYEGDYKTTVEVIPASDADESPQLFKTDKYGWVLA